MTSAGQRRILARGQGRYAAECPRPHQGVHLPEAQLYREILDAQLEMVCRFRRDGTILFVNRAYAEPLGTTPEALTGRNLWQFVTAADRAEVEARVDLLTPEHPEITIENRIETTAGPRWVLWRNHGLEFDEDGHLLVAQSSGFDITDRKQLEEQRQLLVDELNHRVRNTLTVVQGMARQSFREDHVSAEALETFTARLHALAAAHTILSGANWRGAGMDEIVRAALAICGDQSPRIAVTGPEVELRPGAALALALILHELATNALKYGALSTRTGRVEIAWQRQADRLELAWQESGGPAVTPPVRRGFGSRLLESSIRGQLAGTFTLDYAPAGVRCTMEFPLG